MTRQTLTVEETEKYQIIYVDSFGDDGTLVDCFFEVLDASQKCLGNFPNLDAAQAFAATL